MALLKSMLEKDPEKRISTTEILEHPAFFSNLSKSPLILRPGFDPQLLLDDVNKVEG